MVTYAVNTESRSAWVLVAGGFHRHGGMDKANAALAQYLADHGTSVHLVAHEVDPQLTEHPSVTVYLARKPAGSVLLGESYLDRVGRSVAAAVAARSPHARVLVNGGNCNWPDINWVHSVHHAWAPRDRRAPAWFRAKNRAARLVARRREALVLGRARVILANSERTRRELVEYLSLDPSRVHTVYPGADPDSRPASADERAKARAWLGKSDNRPLVGFVGAMGHDDNKGFDTLWSAWSVLCSRDDWDADLIAVGGGLGSAFWRRMVTRSSLAPRATLLGFTDRVTDVLAAADLLVSPVRYEAYGLNVQEAICRGVPAMVSSNAGIAERYPIELRDLLIPDSENAEDLAMRMLRWRPNLLGWKERILPFARELRRHTWRQMARQIVSIAEQPCIAASISESIECHPL